MSKLFSSRRVRVSLAGLSVLALGLAGCGGGSSGGGGGNKNNANASLPNTTVAVLTANNRLALFNAQRPNNVQQVTISGLRASEQLIGIDVRYTNTIFTQSPVLYGLANLSGTYQLYRIVQTSPTAADATAVGTQFSISPALGTIGFDFNPVPDRIRVVDATTQRNLRLNPDTGAIVDADPVTAGLQLDGTLTYDVSDVNNGSTPQLAGAAYTNNDADGGTGTSNFAIDVARGTLVSQGDDGNGAGADTGISPNTGRLFTVGTLSTVPATADLGFDITPANLGADGNRGLVAFATRAGARPRLFEVSLTTGQLTGGAFINVPATTGVLDIAAVNVTILN